MAVLLCLLCLAAHGDPKMGVEKAPASRYPRVIHQGQLQMQLDGGSLGAARPQDRFPNLNGLSPFPASSRIFARRFRPAWTVELNDAVDLKTELQLDLVNEKLQILDVRADYKFSPSTMVSLGRFKVPFGWEGYRSSRTVNTIERSDMTVALYHERDIGVLLSHQDGGMDVSLGAFLGRPRAQGRGNGQYDVIARGAFQLTPQLKAGVSGQIGSFRPDDNAHDLPVRRWGTEAQYQAGKWGLEAEAIWSDGYNPVSRADTRAFGYQATALCRVLEPLDVVLSYDRFDPDTARLDPVAPNNGSNSRGRKVVGLNFYFDRASNHRLMLDYEWRESLEGPGASSRGPRLRYQLTW